MKHLGEILNCWRWQKRITVRDAAVQIGLSASTYSRLERGCSIDGDTLATVLAWLLRRDVADSLGGLDADPDLIQKMGEHD